MNRAINAGAARKSRVGGVDNGIRFFQGNITLDKG
jgi:hypothetical protein